MSAIWARGLPKKNCTEDYGKKKGSGGEPHNVNIKHHCRKGQPKHAHVATRRGNLGGGEREDRRVEKGGGKLTNIKSKLSGGNFSQTCPPRKIRNDKGPDQEKGGIRLEALYEPR